MPTLDYQRPVAKRRRPLSWSYAPPFVLLALGAAFVSLVFSAHGGDGKWMLLALTGPAIVCVLPFSFLSELFVLTLLLIAAVAQFTAYFAVFRSRHSRHILIALGFHVTCCAGAWVWTTYFM